MHDLRSPCHAHAIRDACHLHIGGFRSLINSINHGVSFLDEVVGVAHNFVVLFLFFCGVLNDALGPLVSLFNPAIDLLQVTLLLLTCLIPLLFVHFERA